MKILLTGFVGALIGYITNWLAIKMIFRPHERKYIGKIKIPFTPGLIPKEKARIAKSVGGAVGSHLLTEETIQEYLGGEKIESTLKKWMRDKLNELVQEKATIGSVIKSVIGEKHDKLKNYFKKIAKDYVKSLVEKEESRKKVVDAISGEALKIMDVKLLTVTESEIFKKLESHLLNKLKEAKASKEVNGVISKAVMSFVNDDINREKKLNEMIPDSTQKALFDFVENNREELCEKIINGLQKDTIKEKITVSIDEMVNTKLSPMIAMFLKGDTVYPMIVNTLEGYLGEDENRMMLVGLINTEIEKYMDHTIEELIEKHGQDKIESIINEGSNILLNNFVNDETIDKLFNKLIGSFEEEISLKEFILKIHSGAFDKIDVYIDSIVVNILKKDEIIDYMENCVNSIVTWGENVKIEEILSKNEGMKESLEVEVVNLYKGFMENNSSKIAKTIDIPAIVEEKINDFKMTEMEEIILEIASKELKAITWFGALLGFVMGVVSAAIGNM